MKNNLIFGILYVIIVYFMVTAIVFGIRCPFVTPMEQWMHIGKVLTFQTVTIQEKENWYQENK
jgi:hypothetical protein